MSQLPPVRVNRKAAGRIASGHPWIFASDVTDRGDASPGDAVRIVDQQGRGLGVAHYSSTSQITLRLLSARGEESIDGAFFAQRLQTAANYRQRVVAGSDAYRLVHAEGDLLPGLIIDRYGDYFAVQMLSQGMDRASGDIVQALSGQFAPKGIIARNDAPVRTRESLPVETHVLEGEIPERVPIRMNGLTWHADLIHGQKTGVFLDQRENYLAAAQYASGRALDCFTATGGFALHLAERAESVEAVDSSGPALAIAESNRQANGISNVTFREADVFELLPALHSAGRKYSLVVLDPPAFAKSRGNIQAAVRGYREINLRALKLLDSGGILVSCSCSHHVSEAMLLETIAAAALDTGRQLRVLERRTQARDHPILLTVPETHYLKCLILEVL